MMNWLDELVAFERWNENGCPLAYGVQVVWYKLMWLNNKCGWQEWFQVDNRRLMFATGISNEKTLIGYRNKLIEAGLIEYQKGKKGSPNKYKIKPLSLSINTVNNAAHSTVQTTVEPTAINKQKTETETIKKKAKAKKEKAAYGEFQNVLLSDDEFAKLAERVGTEQRNIMIERLGSYMASTGKKYVSHYATILNWQRKDESDGVNRNSGQRRDSKADQTGSRKGKFDDLKLD